MNRENQILDNKTHVALLKSLFSSVLSGQEYTGNKYIWNSFKAFTLQKDEIKIHTGDLGDYCHNKGLLDMIMLDIERREYIRKEKKWVKYSGDKYADKNLLKPEILSVFSNVKSLSLKCDYYPFSLDSLLLIMKDTKIKTVSIDGMAWVPDLAKLVSSSNDIVNRYSKNNFEMKFSNNNNVLSIESKV